VVEHGRHGSGTEAIVEPAYDDARLTAVGVFAEAFLGLSSRLAVQLAEHNLSPIEFGVLIRLARAEYHRLRMSDLATKAHLTTSGITRVVDRMERDGLVARSACETDRRSLYAVVTDAGLDRLAEVLPGHVDMIDRWFTGQLSADQLAKLLSTLCVVRDAVSPDNVR
jgi:MarR family 2-MHQ and catechol resistance regulon transcriptional repressor